MSGVAGTTVLGSLVALALIAPASALGITVNRADDQADPAGADAFCDVDVADADEDCTLRAAIQTADGAAHPGADTIEFAPGLGTILLADQTPVIAQQQDLTIVGPGAGALTVDGQDQADWIFNANTTSATVRISGLTLTRGRDTGTGNPQRTARAGGVRNHSGTMILDRVVVTGNSSSAGSVNSFALGGGVYNTGKMEIRESTIAGNSALATGSVAPNPSSNAQGAGIYNETFAAAGESLLVQRSTISGNGASATIVGATGTASATAEGGGIFNVVDSDLSLDRVTVSGNTAETFIGGNAAGTPTADGGGVGDDSDGLLQSSTITDNRAGAATNGSGTPVIGGSNLSPTATTAIHNTVIAAPRAGDSCDAAGGASSYSVESPGNTCGLAGTGDQVNVSAAALALEPTLASNGGPTLTHKLLGGSVAIDQGLSDASIDFAETTDQRGQPRPVPFAVVDAVGGDGSDVGAYELQQPARPDPPATTPAPAPAPATTAPAAVENPECATLRATLSRLNRKIKKAEGRKKAKLKKNRRKVRRRLTELGCVT